MKIDILTLFPEMIDGLSHSIIARAENSGILNISAVNIRDFSKDKHLKCDDYTFGGGNGMLMTPQPIFDALQSVDENRTARRIYMSPKGKLLDAEMSARLSHYAHIVILCGHYEGVDQRIIDNYIDEEISIGDYVLTGGELPAMVLVDCLSRRIDGVLGNSDSAEAEESFNGNLLEYPQYTRPQDFNGFTVPDILLSGNHQKIKEWRLEHQEEITKSNRPDLYEKYIACKPPVVKSKRQLRREEEMKKAGLSANKEGKPQ